MSDDAAELLLGAREKARHVFEGHERNIEGVAEAQRIGPP